MPKTKVIFLALSLQHNLDGEPVITATNERPIERYSGGFAYHSPNTGETYWVPDAAVTRASVKIVSE